MKQSQVFEALKYCDIVFSISEPYNLGDDKWGGGPQEYFVIIDKTFKLYINQGTMNEAPRSPVGRDFCFAPTSCMQDIQTKANNTTKGLSSFSYSRGCSASNIRYFTIQLVCGLLYREWDQVIEIRPKHLF